MPLIINGTTIPASGTINYNGTSLTEIIFNGVTVWQKSFTVISNGDLLDKNYITSAPYSGYSDHSSISGNCYKITGDGIYFSYNLYGVGTSGTYTGEYHECNDTSWVQTTIKFSSDIVGQSVTAKFACKYAARYFDADYEIRNGGSSGTVLYSGSGHPSDPVTKTFTMSPDGLYFKISFPCDNDSWCPHGWVGIIDLQVN
jgi:hypothetical protein